MNDQAIDQCYAKAKGLADAGLFERSISFIDRALDIAARACAGSRYDQVVADLNALRSRVQSEQRASEIPPEHPQIEVCNEAAVIITASSHYAALGLAADVPQEGVRPAYIRLATRFHPDKHSADKNVRQLCETAFKRISEAFRELSDEDNRRRYDQKQAHKRSRNDSAPPNHGKKQKTEASAWYATFWNADRLFKVDLTQSHIAGYCVRQIYRLASFMQGGGDDKYDWYGLASRYAFHPRNDDDCKLERVLWRFGGIADYMTQVEELQRLFKAGRFPRISVHLDCLKAAIERYMVGNADVEPTPVPDGACVEIASQAFVDGVRRLCLKMISMQDKKANWEELLKKFPSGQASQLSIEAAGVDFCEMALRDIMATTDSNLVKRIATQLIVSLARVRARTVSAEEAALEKARTLRRELAMLIGSEIARDYPTVKKIARMLPAQVATKSKEACRDDIVRYFCTSFADLSLARAVWTSMCKEALKSCLVGNHLLKTLKELQDERNANVWRELLSENSGSAGFLVRYNSITSKFAAAVAYDGHVCSKTEQLYREIRSELFIYLHEALALEQSP